MSDYFMKSRALLRAGICVAALLVPMQVYAVGPQNITNTVHNLGSYSSGGPFTAKDPPLGTAEVCVFCHTPHNSSAELPLWNRYSSSGAKGFVMYTSSMTLTSKVKNNQGISANSVSRLCLSCHDGTTALNALFSTAATGGTRPEMDGGNLSFGEILAEGEGAYLGTNLVNMHPINFNYDLAQVEEGAGLVVMTIVDDDLKFFDDDGDGSANFLECPTCHDPHVDFGYVQDNETGTGDVRYRPFLRKSNVSSGLCLTCHNK